MRFKLTKGTEDGTVLSSQILEPKDCRDLDDTIADDDRAVTMTVEALDPEAQVHLDAQGFVTGIVAPENIEDPKGALAVLDVYLCKHDDLTLEGDGDEDLYLWCSDCSRVWDTDTPPASPEMTRKVLEMVAA